ncbi:alpha/beta fold hydrolase [Dyella sp.]|uniref:alpha/beta fold hydrolase n=1 Tax=Dyella sp. TaxID=1869338 RepID=UPI002ECFFB05
MNDLAIHYFTAPDGVRLAYRELGQGRPLVLIHGFFSTATVNWLRYGHAAKIASRGYRVIMPDLRGHGDSAKPHDTAAYPPDVLASDGFALIEHLGLGEYDLGGYSLGARTSMRMLVHGASPARAILGGMGLEGVLDTAGRGAYFRHLLGNLGTFPRGSSEFMAEAFLKTVGGDPQALLCVLDTFVDTSREELARITTPALIVTGKDDHDNGSAKDLADVMPEARYVEVPGTHMSAVTLPPLGDVMADYLGNAGAA